MSKPVLIIDSQILNSFQSCQTKFYYDFVLNVKTLIKPVAFDKGDLLHYMLKFHYKMIRHNQRKAGKEIPYSEIVKTCITKAEKYLVSLDLDSELGTEVIKTYYDYSEYYRNCSWQILEVEKPFARVIHEDENIKIIYCGIIDLLTNVAIVDHKSSSRRGTPSGLSNQFMGYAYSLDVHNVVINKVGFQKTLKNEEKFERHTKSYPTDNLNEWKENTIKVGLEIYKGLNDVLELQKNKNFTSCDKYSGCIFQRICESSPEAREFVIQKDYRIGDSWKPLKTIETI